MIREQDLLSVKHWFWKYTRQFRSGNHSIDSAIGLKVKHSKNVAADILDIANTLNLDTEHCYLAEIVALLHDIGRFEQFMRHHTYSDKKSEDHAQLGVEVISQTGVLDEFTTYEQDLICTVVAHHNRFSLPQSNDRKLLLLLKLLRDADKIDILHVVTEHYAGYDSNNAINMDLPDTPDFSDEIIRSIRNRTPAEIRHVKTLNDFKLLQISWVFDINFPKTYQLFNKRRYIKKLSETLPQDNDIKEVIASAHVFLRWNCTNERSVNECRIP